MIVTTSSVIVNSSTAKVNTELDSKGLVDVSVSSEAGVEEVIVVDTPLIGMDSSDCVVVLNSNELILSAYHFKPLGVSEPEVISGAEVVSFTKEFVTGWNMLGFPVDVSKTHITHNYSSMGVIGDVVDYTTSISQLIKDHLYENESDDTPYFYKEGTSMHDLIAFVKDVDGASYIPQWDYDGIGDFNQYVGFAVKTFSSMFLKIKAELHEPIDTIDDFKGVLINGWQYIGFNSLSSINASTYFAPLDENIVMASSNSGAAYLPEFSFNGIGDLIPGEAYRIKLKNL